MKFISTFLFLLFISINSNAQVLKATVNDLSFMAGVWMQDHEWGKMEETWSKPMGNCVMASFRCVKDEKVIFYEFMVVEQGETVPVLKLRHFNPGSIGWEDKNSPMEFPLVLIEKNKAVFEAADHSLKLSYTVTGSKMQIVLDEKNKEGKMETTYFNMVASKE
jgi:hypothetical protein